MSIRHFLGFAAILILMGISPVQAESWLAIGPELSLITEKVFRSEDRLNLYVPATFEGRTAKEWRKVKGVELFNCARFERTDAKVQLRGTVTVFDFDYVKDRLDIQVFRSRALRPGRSACMDCHGGELPRTTVIIGQETIHQSPKPVSRGNIRFTISEAHQDNAHFSVSHWLTPKLMARTDLKVGKLRQGEYRLRSVAATAGLAGMVGHRLVWDGRIVVSKTETYSRRKTLIGKLAYRFGKRLKLIVAGGAFFDGYTQFGTDMSEMGAMTVSLEKDDPSLLPSLFTRLKDDKFGYIHTSLLYEYPF